MKFEQKDKSIESINLEIKKAKESGEVEIAAEEFETEAIAKAVENEIPDKKENGNESAMQFGKEALIRSMELNPEAKERNEAVEKITEYSREIYEIGKGYEMVYSHFEPKGADGKRGFNDELDLFLKSREKGEDYQPVFTYPGMDKQKIEDLGKKVSDLEAIEAKVNDERNEHVKNVVLEMSSVIKAKIGILIEILNGDPKRAFEKAKIAYGDIDDELCRNAEDWHKRKMEYLKEKNKRGVVKSEMEKKMEGNEFNAEDIKAYFDMALNKANLRYEGIEVIIDDGVESIDVRPSDQNHDHPVVLIPPKRIVKGGLSLLQLVAHEIGNHVTQNYYNHKLGFGGTSFGKDWEALQEGFAMINEAKIKKEMIGESYPDFEMQSGSYYILAMNKIKQGADIGEVYDYIYNLKKEESIAKGDNEKKSEEEALKGARIVLRRVTRGMYPYYFPKDIAYFKGEFMAKKMEEANVDKYPLQSRIDPALIPDMIEAGIYLKSYAYEKGLEAAINVAKKIWEDNGWPIEYIKDKKWFADDFIKNKKWYEDNMQMDRYLSYRKEFMSESGEKDS